MKQHISLIFTIALLLAVSFGCKVGDEDPASLASRDGRLAATWNLTAAEDTDVYKDPSATRITTKTYDGTTLTTTKMDQDTITDSDGYELQLVIEKGEIALITQTYSSTGQTVVLTYNTRWSWVGGDRKKSMLIIYSPTLGGPEELLGTWEVLRLSKKELILYQYYKSTSEVNSASLTGTATHEYVRKYTFEAE